MSNTPADPAALRKNLKWGSICIWIQVVFSAIVVGFVVAADLDEYGALISAGAVLAATLALALYLTILSVKASRHRQLALPWGSATGGNGTTLVTLGAIYTLLAVAGGIVAIVKGQWIGISTMLVGCSTGGLVMRAGHCARALHRAYQENPTATASLMMGGNDDSKMSINSVGPTGFVPTVPLQQPAMYGVPQQQQQQFGGYVPIATPTAMPATMGQWSTQPTYPPAQSQQPSNPLFHNSYA